MIKISAGIIILSCLLLVFSSCQIAQTQSESTGLKIIKSSIIAHGGNNLENLKTLRIKSKDSLGFEDTSLFDLTNKKYRRERRKNNDLEVTQIEGNEGWTWTKNNISELSERQKYIWKLGFCMHELSLRSKCLETTSFGETIIDEEAKSKYLSIKINGEEFGYVIDEKNRLKEITKDDRGVIGRVVFDDFRTVNGIVFAFSKTAKASIPNYPTETKGVVTKILSIEVNPEFTASDWAVPN